MKFSIVTISCNQVRYLERAILSVISQEGVEVEYIVVDPGSTDGSRELIGQYRDRIAVAILERDTGPSDGLNRGFSVATGDVFGFLNSDDELLPGALARIAEAFELNPRADVVSGCGYFVDGDDHRLRAIVPSMLTPWLYGHGGVSVFQQGTFFKAEWFRRVGGFRMDNRTCWDGELFLDMALAGARFVTIGSDVANFRIHEGSITGSGRLNEKYRIDCERLFEKTFGRKRGTRDALTGVLARLAKWLVDPTYLVRRLSRLRVSG
jgi:glycosyltransferase involved in cell wall biosynthesis